jgi:RHS repeat-associated protein
VTPDGGTSSARLPNTSGHSASFTVTNTGNAPDLINISCWGSSGVTCTGTDVSSIQLDGGATGVVYAFYSVGAVGTGVLTLNGQSNTDDLASNNGTRNIPIVAAPQYAVSVTPDGALRTRAPSATFTDTFYVANTGSQGATFTLTPSCNNSSYTCVTPISTLWIAAGTTAIKPVTYPTGSTLTTITIALTATYGSTTDQGSFNVTVAPTPGKPLVAFKNQNDSIADRSLCLTMGAGEAAAHQCGDLLVSHSMPGFNTLGRDRALTLLYTSRQARPFQLIAATVTNGGTAIARPSTVDADLWINKGAGFTLARAASWTPWGNPGGALSEETKQVSLAYDATGDSTGAYPFRLLTKNVYPLETKADTLTGIMLVVNRNASQFGRGWSLAGVERIYFNQPVSTQDSALLWVGGDGSARLYQRLYAGTWEAPAAGFRDRIVYNSGTQEYTRTLRHGITVVFDAQGRHKRTTNRVGQVTSFQWNATATHQLDAITVSPTGQSWTTYTLQYLSGKLDRILDPVGRTLEATVTSGELRTLVDPVPAGLSASAFTTQFVYIPDGHMSSRTSSRGYVTTYGYGTGIHLSSATIPRDTIQGALVSDVTTYANWNEFGYSPGQTGNVASDTANVRTIHYGPRAGIADDTRFVVNRYGAPVATTNAYGHTTTYNRTDAAFPALVTKVLYPTGWTVEMKYNARGNLSQVRDSTGETGRPLRVTTYAYNDGNAADSPSQITDALGRATTYAYNALGLTDLVTDARGHQTKMWYQATGALTGLVDSIAERNVETWLDSANALNDTTDYLRDHVTRFAYNTRGNLKRTTSPLGLVTSYVSDSIGRVTDVYDPFNLRQRRFYDVLNRVTRTRQYNAAETNPYGYTFTPAACDATQVLCADSSRAFNPVLSGYYNTEIYPGPAGMDSIIDPRGVKRSYRYSALGSLRRETDDYDAHHYTYVNAAGLPDSAVTRKGDRIRYYYDYLGRRIGMAFSQKSYTSHVVPGDSVVNTYGMLGELLTATNIRGSITRTYYKDGSLKTQQSVTDFTESLAITYDAAGAPLQVTNTGAGGASDVTTYTYNATTGDLTSMAVAWGSGYAFTRTFSFLWDGLGRRRQITYPKNVVVKYRYDKSGTLRRLKSGRQGNPVGDVFAFTFRNRLIDANGRLLRQELECGTTNAGNPCGGPGIKATISGYNRLGMLVEQQTGGASVDSMRYDASGNMIQRRSGGGAVTAFTIPAAHNRVTQMTLTPNGGSTPLTLEYYGDGSRYRDISSPTDLRLRYFYYDGMGRPTGTLNYVAGMSNPHDGMNACLYDADGQMYKPCDNGSPSLAFQGNNVVGNYEGNTYWRFVHAPGLDDPIAGVSRGFMGTKELFYVTDGAGRHFAAADSTGYHDANLDNSIGWQGWRFNGASEASNSFSSSRLGSNQYPGLAMFRNRIYDQGTGRWTQEDPIGVAGGINLYQFNGNNPVTYTDPFGLCPWCVVAGVVAVEALKGAVVGAVVGAVEQVAVNKLSGRPLLENVGTTAADGAAVGAVTGGLGSLARIGRVVSRARKATGLDDAVTATRAEAQAAGELHVGSNRLPMFDRRTGTLSGQRNAASGAKYRWETGKGHVNLENGQGGNVHVHFPE